MILRHRDRPVKRVVIGTALWACAGRVAFGESRGVRHATTLFVVYAALLTVEQASHIVADDDGGVGGMGPPTGRGPMPAPCAAPPPTA